MKITQILIPHGLHKKKDLGELFLFYGILIKKLKKLLDLI